MRVDDDQSDHFSYAAPDDPRLKRLLIGAIESMTGQPHLKHLYDTHRNSRREGESFWAAATRLLELKIVYNEEALAKVPRQGALVVVANHPFGVLDGIVIGHLIAKVRSDFRVLTNSVLYRAEEIRSHLLPIDFSESKAAMEVNIRSRAEARAHLKHGGCLVIFPAGGASTAPRPWSRRAVDAEWKSFAARLIDQARAPVLPVYFAGQNSRLFQIVSHISLTLRLSLFFKEVYDKIGSEIRVRIGTLIRFEELEGLDRKLFMQHLRAATYAMAAHTPNPPCRKRIRATRQRREKT